MPLWRRRPHAYLILFVDLFCRAKIVCAARPGGDAWFIDSLIGAALDLVRDPALTESARVARRRRRRPSALLLPA
jgi:hypothetical protein